MAVTGLGVVSAAGASVDDFWTFLLSGKSAVGRISRFDADDLPVKIAAEIETFDDSWMAPKDRRVTDRFVQLGIAAAGAAIDSAGHTLAGTSIGGVFASSALGGIETLESEERTLVTRGPSRIHPLVVPMFMANGLAAAISMRWGLTGPACCLSNACAGGTMAIGEAARQIRHGYLDFAVAGGAEAPITSGVVGGFARLGALSQCNDAPSQASRPFDARRDGFVLAEGAAFLFLESLEAARARGATVYCEVAGYASTSDAFHLTQPPPDGRNVSGCIALALRDSATRVLDVAHVNAHGTSTPVNDDLELDGIRRLFGEGIPLVTSIKGAIGHSLGAAGAIEAVAGALSAYSAIVPPTANFVRGSDAAGVSVVRGAPLPLPSGLIVSTSFAFGGHNAALVLLPDPD